MMKYLPFENITYQTKLDSEEILKRINEIIEPERTFRLRGIFKKSNSKPYEGSIIGNAFNLTRLIGYKNSFLPRIKGNIEKDFGLTKVHVKMRLHPFVLVFMTIWCVVVSIAFLAFFTVSVGSGVFVSPILIPIGMLMFVYGLTTIAFKYESIKSKKYLAELFDAEII